MSVAPVRAQADRWVEARGGDLVVVSDAGVLRARETFDRFARIRGMLGRVLSDARFEPRKPVVIYAVDGERGLRQLVPQFWEQRGRRPAAAYWAGPHRHYIAFRIDASDRELDRRALHEYAHLMMHERVSEVPAWLDEGMSEFWSSAAVRDDVLEVGQPLRRHLRTLRGRTWIPLDELLAMTRTPDPRDTRRLSLFYAQSWLLAHYLLLGWSSASLEIAPTLTPADIAHMKRTLAGYAGSTLRTIRIGVPPATAGGSDEPAPPPALRSLARAEALAIRAQGLLDGERPMAASPVLKEALGLDQDAAVVLECLGYFYFRQNQSREAADAFDRAIRGGSASYLAYYYRAVLSDRRNGENSIESDLRRAIELNPAFATAYARLADFYVQLERLEPALPLMRSAVALEPGYALYWVDLGRLLLRLNRPVEAREAGEQGLAAVGERGSRGAIEAFLKDLARAQTDGPIPQ